MANYHHWVHASDDSMNKFLKLSIVYMVMDFM